MGNGGLDAPEHKIRLRVRTMQPDDAPQVIALQKVCFPGMQPWGERDLHAHISTFAEGQIVVEYEGRVVASSSSLRIDFDDYEDAHDFRRITAGGSIRNHDPEGRHLYGIEVMVHPDHRDKRLGRRLYDARKELCRRMNLESILIAGRMPGYGAVADGMTPREYLDEIHHGERWDPVISFQMRNGFQVRQILSGYLPGDKESQGYAALMEWRNLDHSPTGVHTHTARPVRVTVIQYQMRAVDGFEDFARQTEYFVSVAADHASDFAVFPELLTTQLLSCMKDSDPIASARKLGEFTERYLDHFSDLSVRYAVNILGGTHIVSDGDELRNVAFFFRRDGTVERQEKLHITSNEQRWWGIQPGDRLNVFDTDAGRVAVLVCYDAEFPELARVAVARGARILLVPYCTEDRQGHLRVRYCAQARAIENQVYVVTAGTVGNLPDTPNMDIQYAQSAIFTPSDFAFPRDGIAGETTPNVEMVVVGDLDLQLLKRVRKRGSVTNLLDRRLDLYEVRDLERAKKA